MKFQKFQKGSRGAGAKTGKGTQAKLRKFKGALEPAPPSRGEFLRARNSLIFIIRRLAILTQHERAEDRAEITQLEEEHDDLLTRFDNICSEVRIGDVAPSRLEI